MIQNHHLQWLTLKLLVLGLVLLAVPGLLLALPQPAHAQGACSGSRDYGDAPSSYGDACATPNAGLVIGRVVPDSEAGSQYSVGANGDDTNGTRDENFLNPLTPIDLANPQYLWAVPVTNTYTNTAYLAGWIDFNGNGTFESNERASATVITGSTRVTLTWDIPITATAWITTYARLRISPNSSVGPTGDYGNGEVEDYAVTTVESTVCAPGTSFYYVHGTPNQGNAWIATFDVSTGITKTVNDPPTPSDNTLDSINGLAVDQWRGLIYFQDAANNTTPDGIFYYSTVSNTNGTVTNDAELAPLNLPLANGWQTAGGAFANGKYYVSIDGSYPNDPIYEITLDSTGTLPVTSRLLVNVGNPPNQGGNTSQGYGDILIIGNRLYVTYWSNLNTNTQYFDVYDINSQLRLSRRTWGTGADAFALQLARDGNGQVYAIASNNGRVYTVDLANATINGLAASPVITIPLPATWAVHDASECPVAPMDFGDAPRSYGTEAGPRAARHALTNTLRLGSVITQTVIRDLRGFPSGNADGDDSRNYNGGASGGTDDEDSVSTLPLLPAASISYSVTNIVVFNNTGTPATLYGWIDFNRDGQFQQSERATVTIPSSAATQMVTLTWSSLSGLVPGQSYLRLRLSTATTTMSSWGTGNDGAFLATGYAADGEVEDYAVQIYGPTAVSLSSFNARGELSGLADRQTAPGLTGLGPMPAYLWLAVLALSLGGLWLTRRIKQRTPPPGCPARRAS